MNIGEKRTALQGGGDDSQTLAELIGPQWIKMLEEQARRNQIAAYDAPAQNQPADVPLAPGVTGEWEDAPNTAEVLPAKYGGDALADSLAAEVQRGVKEYERRRGSYRYDLMQRLYEGRTEDIDPDELEIFKEDMKLMSPAEKKWLRENTDWIDLEEDLNDPQRRGL